MEYAKAIILSLLCASKIMAMEAMDKDLRKAVLAHPDQYPSYMIEEALGKEEERAKEEKRELLRLLRYPFNNSLCSKMQDAIRELDYEGAEIGLKDIEKLTDKQSKIFKALLKRKYESLKREAFDLQDEKMKAEYSYVTFKVLPILDKIRDLILSKIVE